MKICIAQTRSYKGQIEKNIKAHLRIIDWAIEGKADVVIFPELSITGYEPELAKDLAATVMDSRFDVFQQKSDEHELSICIGMPTPVGDGLAIGMFIFQPDKPPAVYAKQMLHEDELPFFVCGKHQVFVEVEEYKIGVGICYEALQREHFINAKRNGTDIYLASVAKPQRGIEKANAIFPELASTFATPILMSNSVGYCDNFLSVGQSAVWNAEGQIAGLLDSEHEGFLIFDTDSSEVASAQLRIVNGRLSDLQELYTIYRNGKAGLERQGIFQWTDKYPTRSIIQSDLEKGVLHVLKVGSEIIGAINISEEQEEEYQSVGWQFDSTKVMVIHRLVVDVKHQGKGYAQELMDFAESFASEKGYTSIRLDAYSQNNRVLEFYAKRSYSICGQVWFPYRELPFCCLEKEVTPPR